MVLVFALCLFILPLAVAAEGARYLHTSSGFPRNGMPCSWLLLAASMMVAIGGLKNAWCMYFNCCCLYGSVYRLLAVWSAPLFAGYKSKYALSLFLFIGLIGSFHMPDYSSLHPANTSSPL